MEHLKTKLLKALSFVGMLVLLSSCYYDVAEELYPEKPVCDTTNVSFTDHVFPIINTNCTSCHGGQAPAGNIRLENYNDISAAANNGSLLGVIRHEQGWSPMPKGGGKLNDCDITKIEIWANQGTQNN